MTIALLFISCCLVIVNINIASCQQHQETLDSLAWPFDDPNKFGFVGSSKSQDVDSNNDGDIVAARRIFKTSDGRKASVFDNVLSQRTITLLLEWLYMESNPRFHENTTYAPGNLHNIASDYQRGAPWTSSYDPTQFASFEAGDAILSLVKNVSSREMDLYEVTALTLRKGDVINIHHDSSHQKTDYTALVFLNHLWFKNDYGELMLYDGKDDVFAAVTPKFNRVVIWDSSIDYLTRPPSMGCIQSQRLLMLRYTTNDTKVKDSYTAFQFSKEELKQQREQIFSGVMLEEIDEEIDVANHVVQKYKSLADKQIFVLDDLFPSWILEKLRRFTLDYGVYHFDDHVDATSDNVQWIAAFEIDPVIKTRIWNVIRQVASHVSGTDKWFPYDVSCNLIRSYDYTRIHEDCEVYEDEWTFLLYINPDWDYNCQGETAYMEEGGDDAEYITTVLPKFGRAVIFQGIIPHSARPPSSACQQPRLSFAVKVSVNEWVARQKTLIQDSEQEAGMHLSALRLIQLLKDQDFDQKYEEEQRERRKELIKMKHHLNARYTVDMSDEEEDEDEDEHEDEHHDDHHDDHGLIDPEELAMYKEFPQLLQRKRFIYTGIVEARQDASKLKNHFLKFKEEFEESRQKFINLFAKILTNQ